MTGYKKAAVPKIDKSLLDSVNQDIQHMDAPVIRPRTNKLIKELAEKLQIRHLSSGLQSAEANNRIQTDL